MSDPVEKFYHWQGDVEQARYNFLAENWMWVAPLNILFVAGIIHFAGGFDTPKHEQEIGSRDIFLYSSDGCDKNPEEYPWVNRDSNLLPGIATQDQTGWVKVSPKDTYYILDGNGDQPEHINGDTYCDPDGLSIGEY